MEVALDVVCHGGLQSVGVLKLEQEKEERNLKYFGMIIIFVETGVVMNGGRIENGGKRCIKKQKKPMILRQNC